MSARDLIKETKNDSRINCLGRDANDWQENTDIIFHENVNSIEEREREEGGGGGGEGWFTRFLKTTTTKSKNGYNDILVYFSI